MSIKGIDKELFIGKTEVNIFDSKRKRYTIKYENLDKIEYRLADQENGKLYFLTKKRKLVSLSKNLKTTAFYGQ